MGSFAIKPVTKIIAWIVAAILVFLNARLVVNEMLDVFAEDGHIFIKIIIVIAALAFAWLFIMMTFYPFYFKRKSKTEESIHGAIPQLSNLSVTPFKKVAIALDFKTP